MPRTWFLTTRPEQEKEHIALPGLLDPAQPFPGARATYPSVGVMGEIIKGLACTVGTDDQLVHPRPNSLETLDLGMRYSPEGACLPFKLLFGSYLQSMDAGADMIGMITERGPCRLGFYSFGMRLVLNDLGLRHGWFDLNNADLRQGYVHCFRSMFRTTYGRDARWRDLLRGIALGFMRLVAVEKLEEERNARLAYEIERGSVMAAFEAGRDRLRACTSPFAVWQALRRARRDLRAVPLDRRRLTVRVLITGEAFCVMDPFANVNLELRLGALGAVPCRALWQRNFLAYPFGLDRLSRYSRRAAVRAARHYLPEPLGGDINSNVGYALLARRRGDDGMIHLKPFGCMMEFVAENILRVVERDTGFPILSLTLDDLTGEERLNVRVEAFVENLFRRRRERLAGRRSA